MTTSDRLWTDADRELVALARASRTAYSQHGQQCPAWKRRPKGLGFIPARQTAPSEGELAACDCWIMSQARRDAERVLDALAAAGWRPIHRVYGYHVENIPGVIPPQDVTLVYRTTSDEGTPA